MLRYTIKRILWIIPIMLAAAFLVFGLLSLTPGDPARIHTGMEASEEDLDRFREQHGLDKSFMGQYFTYIKNVFTKGDMGNSYKSGSPIADRIVQTFPVTFKLALMSLAIMLIIGIPLGIISALKQYSVIDNFVSFFGMIGVSMPNFWLALQLILLFSLRLGWLPASGSGSMRYFILPSITLGVAGTARIMRITRSAILEIYRQDYIKTARAKGQKESIVIWRHMLKNSSLTIITAVSTQFIASLANSTVIETVYSMPGLSKFLIDSITTIDNNAVLGAILVLAGASAIINLITDLILAMIDPRIKSQFGENKITKVTKVTT